MVKHKKMLGLGKKKVDFDGITLDIRFFFNIWPFGDIDILMPKPANIRCSLNQFCCSRKKINIQPQEIRSFPPCFLITIYLLHKSMFLFFRYDN